MSRNYDPGEVVDVERVVLPKVDPVPGSRQTRERTSGTPTRPGTKVGRGDFVPVPKLRLGAPPSLEPQPRQAPPPVQPRPAAVPPPALRQPTPQEVAATEAEEDLDAEMAAFLGNGDRSVVKDTAAAPILPVEPIELKPPPKPLTWEALRGKAAPIVDLPISDELLEAYRAASEEGQASAIHVGGFGETLGEYLYSIFTSTYPARIYARHPFLLRTTPGAVYSYVWTGWGILHQGQLRLVVFEGTGRHSTFHPTRLYLLDPQTLY